MDLDDLRDSFRDFELPLNMSVMDFDIDIVGFDCYAELCGMDPQPEKWVCPFKSADNPGSGCGAEKLEACPLMKQQAEIRTKLAPSTKKMQ
jgi:hypothetical protein